MKIINVYNINTKCYSLFTKRDFSSAREETFNSEQINDMEFTTTSWSGNNVGYFFVHYDDFTMKNFKTILSDRFLPGNTYSVLVKVEMIRFNKNSNNGQDKVYCMLDTQKGIYHSNNKAFSVRLHKVYKDFKKSLIYYLERYDADRINIVQIMYIQNNVEEKLKLKNINKLALDKNIVNVKLTKFNFSDKALPLSTKEKFYGNLLELETDKMGRKRLIINNSDFIENIRMESRLSNKIFKEFPENTRFYLYTTEKGTKYVICVNDLGNNISRKDVYDLTGFQVMKNVIDEVLGNNSFTRTINGTTVKFVDGKVVSRKTAIQFKNKLSYKGYKYNRKVQYTPVASNNIGSFDLEAFKDTDSKSKVYALGFAIAEGLEKKKVTMYYLGIDENDSDKLVIKCIDAMLSPKYRNHIYYAHNFGGYDIVFILAALRKYNDTKQEEHYVIDTTLKDNKILKMVVKVKKEKVTSKITLVDSYNLLTDSLDKLSNSFGSNTKKGLFPHTFVNRDTLHYEGNTPDISFYDIRGKRLSSEIYKTIYKKHWSLKEESLLYLKQDILSLLEIMNNFNTYIHREYNLEITQSLTISRLALNIFLKEYLKETILPVINNVSVFNDIKKAYYGGIVEIYKPRGENLKYYDVNSLYPFVAKKAIPGKECVFIENDEGLDLKDLFGFYYCKVKSNNGYLGLLPVHDNQLILPHGEWEGWYFSEELKFAEKNGYQVKVLHGYSFNKVENVFKDYVDDLYKRKSTSTGSKKLINKFLLNSLLGRFGMDITKLRTEVLTVDEWKKLLQTNPVNSAHFISSSHVLVAYDNNISQEICESHGLDYVKVLNSRVSSKRNADVEDGGNSFDDVAISISAAITSYARIYMHQVKLDILNKGGNIYYTDTDSIVTDIELESKYVGTELGQFKLEYEVKEAYFVANKSYLLILKDEYKTKENKGVIKRFKGIIEDSIDLEGFKNLYYNKENIWALKPHTTKNYLEGYVNIGTKPVNISFDSYTKREKIFDSKTNLWVDTKPIIYNPIKE